jgi:chorismate synthase
MNKFGIRFSFSTFGESHGAGIGCLVDGVPAGLKIDEAFIQSELDRRKPGMPTLPTGTSTVSVTTAAAAVHLHAKQRRELLQAL